MASVTSQASPYDFDSTGDTDESWQYIDYSSGASAAGSVMFLSSPSSGSLNGYAVVGHAAQATPPQTSVSPRSLVESSQPAYLSSGTSAYNASMGASSVGQTGALEDATFSPSDTFLPSDEYLFAPPDDMELTQQELNDLAPFMADFQADFASELPGPGSAFGSMDEFDDQSLFQTDTVASTWNSNIPYGSGVQNLEFRSFGPSSNISVASNSRLSSSPKSSTGRSESSSINNKPLAIRKVKVGKVEKNKANADQSGKFVIMTPTSIGAHAGRPNPFECFEAMRATQRGRKGPLTNETKDNALQVRRLGACFCCHSRKVKCDKERPCKHCKKLAVTVPQIVCWQFQDFIPVLFPQFIRAHFKKDEMARFLSDNIAGFTVGGVEKPCEVELFCGLRFSTVLTVKAKFFTAKTCDVLQHWHMAGDGGGRSNLLANRSAPIGIEFNSSGQKDDLRKQVKTYIQSMLHEPFYAEQVTDSIRSTTLPTKVLRIVQTYAKQSDSTLVKRSLTMFGMHYVMTRHLCITQRSISALSSSGMVPQDAPWVTPRVLARQIKSLIDELIMREMQQIFEFFSKSLKPKQRRDWAPCAAAFLVLCLFIEAIETAADNFATSQNEVNKRNTSAPEYNKDFALEICKELENLPFKQFAYQFHNVYQTHAKDASTKGFNPLFDDSFAEQGELDGPAEEMVKSLRELYHGEDWQDLQFLATDDIILSRTGESHSLDSSYLYTGRLLAKFLLSFADENIIFGGKI